MNKRAFNKEKQISGCHMKKRQLPCSKNKFKLKQQRKDNMNVRPQNNCQSCKSNLEM